MSESQVHIAALFETVAAAHAARDALVAGGVESARILLLDRANPPAEARTAGGLWGTLKRWLVPDRHAHHYAEAVTRGHPLLVADVSADQHDAAVATLEAAHPLDIEETVGNWRDAGWDETHPGQEEWENDNDDEAPGNPGVRSGGLVTGDYGAVGAPPRGMTADTNILRGTGRVRSYTTPEE